MRSLLLACILAHLFFLWAMFGQLSFGGRWIWYLATGVSLLGMLLPFLLRTQLSIKLLNLIPGLLLLSGWGSWVWLVIIDAENPINIWGLIGPVLGILLLGLLLLLSLLLPRLPRGTAPENPGAPGWA